MLRLLDYKWWIMITYVWCRLPCFPFVIILCCCFLVFACTWYYTGNGTLFKFKYSPKLHMSHVTWLISQVGKFSGWWLEGTGNFRKECWTPPTTIGFHISWSVRSDLSKVKFYLNFLKSKNILVTTFLIWWCSRNTEKRSACVWIHFQLSILYEQNKMVLFL